MLKNALSLAVPAVLLCVGSVMADPPEAPEDTQEEPFDLDQIEDTAVYTPHHSIINLSGLDEALIGTWRLRDAFMDLPQLQRSFPTTGRTLSITANGAYNEDYSTARFTDQAAGAGAVLPYGLKSCFETAEFSGASSGSMMIEPYFDLDAEPDENGYPVRFTLYLKRNMGAERPKILCPGSTQNATTTAVSPPLGTGRVESTTQGPRLAYTYSVSADWSVLEMSTQRPPHLRYTFIRQGF